VFLLPATVTLCFYALISPFEPRVGLPSHSAAVVAAAVMLYAGATGCARRFSRQKLSAA
jgi:hypothetical protein